MSNWARLRAEMRDDATASTSTMRSSTTERANAGKKRRRRDGKATDDWRSGRTEKNERKTDATTTMEGSTAETFAYETREGLLDVGGRPRGDERAMETARAERAGGEASSRTSAGREAVRLRVVSRLCAQFERECGTIIGKRWCSSFEEWLTTWKEEPLVPKEARCRLFLEKQLRKCGAEEEAVEKACDAMMRFARDAYDEMVATREVVGLAEVRTRVDKDVVTLSVGKSDVRVNAEHLEKLKEMYRIANGDRFAKKVFMADVYAMVARYDAAQGGQYRFAGGHHTALHGEVFDVLRDAFFVSCELFASPLNARWPTFCSAHIDVDYAFGSLGSYRDFRPSHGSYEVNPPFDEELVGDMSNHLFELLQNATGALTFVVITPYWLNRPCWEDMRRSKFCTRCEVLSVREAGYFEGAQHRKKSRFRFATSDTSVLFLQNEPAKIKHAITQAKIDALRGAFRPKADARKK